MVDYTLTNGAVVIRTKDMAFIPDDPKNRDRQEYDKWVAEGGRPDPFVEPTKPEAYRTIQGETFQVLFANRNLIRTLAGDQSLSEREFQNEVNKLLDGMTHTNVGIENDR